MPTAWRSWKASAMPRPDSADRGTFRPADLIGHREGAWPIAPWRLGAYLRETVQTQPWFRFDLSSDKSFGSSKVEISGLPEMAMQYGGTSTYSTKSSMLWGR